MKKLSLYMLFAALILTSVLANAVTGQRGEVIALDKAESEEICCFVGTTDKPLHANFWIYKLQVLIDSTVLDVLYETAIDYFPSSLVEGTDIGVDVDGSYIVLHAPTTGETHARIASRRSVSGHKD